MEHTLLSDDGGVWMEVRPAFVPREPQGERRNTDSVQVGHYDFKEDDGDLKERLRRMEKKLDKLLGDK